MTNPDPGRTDENESALVDKSLDESLIDAVLALSPDERLRQNDRMITTILQLRQGLAGQSPHDTRHG
jgi:hypothetical protein